METKQRKPVAPFYAVAVLWVICGLRLPLYAPMHLAVLTAVSAAVFFGVNALCKNGGVIGAEAEPVKKAEPKKEKKEETTGNPELYRIHRKWLKDNGAALMARSQTE